MSNIKISEDECKIENKKYAPFDLDIFRSNGYGECGDCDLLEFGHCSKIPCVPEERIDKRNVNWKEVKA